MFNAEPDYGVVSIHHVGILCENLERSIAFYQDLLGELLQVIYIITHSYALLVK
jgi:predicted enzyme related to lactoylglutathione lyase